MTGNGQWFTTWMKRRRAELMRECPFCHYCKVRLCVWTWKDYPVPLSHSVDGDGCAYGWATVDHIIPRSIGGRDTSGNTVLACSVCNAAKGDKRYSQFIAQMKQVEYEVTKS